jgi:hypothetical protein
VRSRRHHRRDRHQRGPAAPGGDAGAELDGFELGDHQVRDVRQRVAVEVAATTAAIGDQRGQRGDQLGGDRGDRGDQLLGDV